MFAELVINIEAALAGTFHYDVPADLHPVLRIGHLVEVEFGRRLAQGIVIALSDQAPVEETKPVIALIDEAPVVWPWQIELARWLSHHYLAPLNACLRLMLPPGLTRWADTVVDVNPTWDGSGRLTEIQQQLVELLRERGSLRGRQLRKLLPKTNWKAAVDQLANRKILRKASVLDPPRVRPKVVRTAELIAGADRIMAKAMELGRENRQATLLYYLANIDDPLPAEAAVRVSTGATTRHLNSLVESNLIRRIPTKRLIILAADPGRLPPGYDEALSRLPMLESEFNALGLEWSIAELESSGLIQLVEQPACISLAIPIADVLPHVLRLRGASIYYDVLTLLRQEARPVAVSEIYAATGAKLQHLRRLVNLDLIRFGSEEIWRDPLADRDFTPSQPPLLTADQARVWGRLKVAMLDAREGPETSAEHISPMPEETASAEQGRRGSSQAFLLHGVTGSGKTEIYMRAIDFALLRKEQAIVLVPEIALTPQTVRRFAARFPGRVAILHSRLSDGERYDTWRRTRQGLVDIVVGPRSALFAPLPNLGVIVVDEEHDPSYQQTPPVPPPYYHAREAAIELGSIVKATIILGSATPDVVTFHRAKSGLFQLLELPKRVMGHRGRIASQAKRLRVSTRYRQASGDPDDALTIPLPPIQVVDLRQELRAGNRSIFSRGLANAMAETLDRGEQAIIFLNRRGTATFVICRDCGHVLACPRCDLPLTYHRPRVALVCHHCGRLEPPHQECPQCGSKRIRYFGLGTEEVEEQVKQRWPKARITRWDRDTTAGKDTHEELLARFINHEADVLVGTQMIAKGLDLPLVTLVGVISADVSLGLPDYHTGERTFQILAQVAGRAGRGLLGGRVILQTYQPEHYAIQAAAAHDYAGFYIEEIRFRTRHNLPPFRRLARLLWIDTVNQRGQREAEQTAKGLRLHARSLELSATEILGPVPPFFNRVDGRYRWHIVIRSPNPARLLADFPLHRGWLTEIDPVSTL